VGQLGPWVHMRGWVACGAGPLLLLLAPSIPFPTPARLLCSSTGKATINELYGSRTAVLVGDYLFAQSSWFLANLDNLEVRGWGSHEHYACWALQGLGAGENGPQGPEAWATRHGFRVARSCLSCWVGVRTPPCARAGHDCPR
jgi:hypothetical protein